MGSLNIETSMINIGSGFFFMSHETTQDVVNTARKVNPSATNALISKYTPKQIDTLAKAMSDLSNVQRKVNINARAPTLMQF